MKLKLSFALIAGLFLLIFILIAPFFFNWDNPLGITLNLASIGIWILLISGSLIHFLVPKKYKSKFSDVLEKIIRTFFEGF